MTAQFGLESTAQFKLEYGAQLRWNMQSNGRYLQRKPQSYYMGRLNIGFKSIFKPDCNNIDYEMYQMRISMGTSYVFIKR